MNKEEIVQENPIQSVSSKKFFKMVQGIETFLKNSQQDECEISFEFIMMSLFPTVLDNIKESMVKSYANGWNEGRAALVNERRTDLDTEGISD